MYPEHFRLSDVPLKRETIANRCLPVSVWMILKYYETLEWLDFELPHYEEFITLFPKTKRLGYPHGQLRTYLNNSELFDEITIEHHKAHSQLELFHLIRQNIPVLLSYDYFYYHSQSESMNSHASVMVGYTPENIIINDLFHGKDYSLERNRFNEAWKLKEMRYILIKPPKPSIRRWMSA